MWNGTERLHEGERVRRKMREKSGKKSQNKVTLYKQHCWDITNYVHENWFISRLYTKNGLYQDCTQKLVYIKIVHKKWFISRLYTKVGLYQDCLSYYIQSMA